MNLSEKFLGAIEPVQKPLVALALAFTALSMTGCASMGRIASQNWQQTRHTVATEVGDVVKSAVRVTNCPIEGAQEPTPGMFGRIVDAVRPTRLPSVGDPTCGQGGAVDRNGVGARPQYNYNR